MSGDWKILQIIPADGWRAAYRGTPAGPACTVLLGALALVEDQDGFQSVEGISLDGYMPYTVASEHPDFEGYRRTMLPGEEPDE
jgi:hypothetical protein